MKTEKILFILAISILGSNINSLHAQDPIGWIEKALDKCESIDQGYYQMTRTMKNMSGPDTMTRKIGTYFKKLPLDTVFGFAFAYRSLASKDTLNSIFYSGNELVYVDSKNKKATITSVRKWADFIIDIKHNYDFYDPITSRDLSLIHI